MVRNLANDSKILARKGFRQCLLGRRKIWQSSSRASVAKLTIYCASRLRSPKLGLGVSLKSYCQSPVSSSLATLKEREQEASLREVSAQLPVELLSKVVSAVSKLEETDTVVGVVLGYIPRKLLRQLVLWKIMVAQTRVGHLREAVV